MKDLYRIKILTNGRTNAEFTVELMSTEIDRFIQPIRNGNPRSNVNWENEMTGEDCEYEPIMNEQKF